MTLIAPVKDRSAIRLALAAASLLGYAAAAAEQPVHTGLGTVEAPFTFAIIADPQLGHRDNPDKVPVDARETLETAVKEINAMQPQPAFVVFLGDLANVFDPRSVENFEACIAPLEPEAILVHGNHDTRPPFEAFRALQRRVNGHEEVFFSFDAGPWHFIVLPSNLPGTFTEAREAESAMLAWLQQDLAAHADRPTVVFEHLHLMPQGLTQTEWYTFPLELRRTLIDLFTRHGNVKYYFNGHVHNGLKNAAKLAWEYRGIRFFTVPTIIHTRPFGDGEYAGFEAGLERGGYYLLAGVTADGLTLRGRLAGVEKEHVFPPATFRPFTNEIEPRWMHTLGELPAAPALANGGFEQGLQGWHTCYRYLADEEPGYVMETRDAPGGGQALYLLTREKGLTWANDEMTEAYQVVAPPARPVLRARYRLPAPFKSGGGFVRVQAFQGGKQRFLMMFHWGEDQYDAHFVPRTIGYAVHGKQQSWAWLQRLGKKRQGMFWKLEDAPGEWHSLTADLAALYDAAQKEPGAYARLHPTRLVVALGTWCNAKEDAISVAWFDDITLENGEAGPVPSACAGAPLTVGPKTFQTQFGQGLIDRLARERARKK